MSAGGSAAPAVPSPLPARSPVVKVEAPTAAGRKVKDGKEKCKAPPKPKCREGREKRATLAASEEINTSDESEEDMDVGVAAAGEPLEGEADGAAAVGFRPAAVAGAAP